MNFYYWAPEIFAAVGFAIGFGLIIYFKSRHK